MNFLKSPTLSICLILFSIGTLTAQKNASVSEIISKIQALEQQKDPKCYATANRLEDFMYGTPLEEDARNFKISIQKELIFYLKEKSSQLAERDHSEKITPKHLNKILAEISDYTISKTGDYLYKLSTGTVTIAKKDFDQYSSVSYGYRSLLSVEQDLFYFSEDNLRSFNSEALQLANSYINLVTLVTLKIADINARKANELTIKTKRLSDTWQLILNESKNKNAIVQSQYPTTITSKKATSLNHNALVKEIIMQKLASYEKYNQLSESVFLRNIQVYFARQKWPTDLTTSNELRNYYLESLIHFSSSLLEKADAISANENNAFIRVEQVQKALNSFLPSYTNTFEDVTFFPNSLEKKITIESYDLDSFRDSGFHWRILGYAFDDLKTKEMRSLDPNAAEQFVEGIAQMGVLVLRLAGTHSHDNQKLVLDQKDLEHAFIQIQALIDTYDYNVTITDQTTITSAVNTVATSGFVDATQKANLQFTHKSSDWLNRLIRGYTVLSSEGVIKLSIPPAFGGSGVACEDINDDGFMDVLLLGGFGNKLYLNNKNGSFKDITVTSGINYWNEETKSFGEVRQPIIADFDNNGTQDIFISYVNDTHRMYSNQGEGNFKDLTETANLGGENAVAGPATAFDYNNDGLLDIFIGYFGNYIEGQLPNLSRDSQNGAPNKLFKNLGDFKFIEVPFTDSTIGNTGWTQALGHADINQDGWQDLIVGNDFGVNEYYLNNQDGTFSEKSKQLGTDKPSYTMNVGITDLNGDFFPDFYISNIVVMQKDEKYVSPNAETQMKFDPKKMANIRTVEANDLFISTTEQNELKTYSLSKNVGRGYAATGWSWDADFFDFDNDGDEDLYCLNGMNDFSVYSSENPFYFELEEQSKTIRYAESSRERNVFFVNENGKLINNAESLGADLFSNARSASYFDFDEDGDLDILINNYHEAATLLENKLDKTNNWIKIKLIGDAKNQVNRDAIGSSLVVKSTNGLQLWREIHSTTGYLSVHPKQQHFGVGKAQELRVELFWSNGEKHTVTGLKANQSYEITYPNKVQVKR